MSHVPPHEVLGVGRRGALSGLVGVAGAALLTAGCTTQASSEQVPASGTTSPSAGGPTPGAMTLFSNPEFNFNSLLALGGSDQGSGDVGEVLTAVNAINKAGLSAQVYVETFRKLGDRLMKAPEGRKPDRETARFRALRASQYYSQALFFVLGSEEPGNEEQLYKACRGAWDTFCTLCDPAPVTASVPYGRTPLPVWLFRPDASGRRRPTVILTNGSDGQNVDMWTYGVSAALARDWNALVYEGPGQGQMIFLDQTVFSARWETVVTPLVDWLTARSDVDADKIALTGLSMGGDLAPRAAAFEHRIAAVVAMPGCLDPWRGFGELRKILTPNRQETNHVWNKEVAPHLSPAEAATVKKRFEPFSAPHDARRSPRQALHRFLHPRPAHQVSGHHGCCGPHQGAHPRSRLRLRTVLPRPAARDVRQADGPEGIREAHRSDRCPVALLADGAQAALRGRLRLAEGDTSARLTPRAGSARRRA